MFCVNVSAMDVERDLKQILFQIKVGMLLREMSGSLIVIRR